MKKLNKRVKAILAVLRPQIELPSKEDSPGAKRFYFVSDNGVRVSVKGPTGMHAVTKLPAWIQL